MEQEFIKNQERLKPQEERQEVCVHFSMISFMVCACLFSVLVVLTISIDLTGSLISRARYFSLDVHLAIEIKVNASIVRI